MGRIADGTLARRPAFDVDVVHVDEDVDERDHEDDDYPAPRASHFPEIIRNYDKSSQDFRTFVT